MDRDLIGQKLESLRKALRRVVEKCPATAEILSRDVDAQDVVSLNLTRAVQFCVDIGAHLISSSELPLPDTMGQTFDVLAEAGIIREEIATRMKKAVGFRNLAVHNYDAINWEIVHSIAKTRMTDFEEFARAVVKALNEGA